MFSIIQSLLGGRAAGAAGAANVGAGAGAGGGVLSGLLSNPMFLSMLSGAGQAMQAGEPISAGIGPIVQQGIGAKSQADFLKKLLAGEVHEGKVTIGEKGMDIHAPQNMMSQLLGDEFSLDAMKPAGTITPEAPAASATPSPSAHIRRGVSALADPSEGQPHEFSYADVAGLSPENITQAFTHALAGEKFEQQKITDLVDMAYKSALTDQAISGTEAAAPAFTIPGSNIQVNRAQYVDWLKHASKDERTASVKNYEYAQQQGYKGSFEDFQDASRTSHIKNYERAVQDGYKGSFNEWLLEVTKAGAMNISELIERTEAVGEAKEEIKRRATVQAPDFHVNVDKDVSDSIENRRKIVTESRKLIENRPDLDPAQAREIAKKAIVLTEMENRIKSAYPEAEVEFRNDGWYVDGTLEVRNPYAR